MSKIYILLTATNTIFARFIRKYTHTPYSHASLSLDDKCKHLYSFSRTYTNNPFLGSFQQEYIDKKVYAKYPNIPCELLEIEITEQQLEEAKKIIKSMEEKKYNKIGLIYKLFSKPYHNDNKYFCSEFVAYTLQKSGIYNFKKPLNFVEPYDFLKLPIVKSVYHGNLHDIH